MVKKIVKYFLIFLIISIFIFISFVSFNSEIRRNILSYSVGGYKFYQKILIKNSLPDIQKASDQLIKYINFTNYLSSEGKNNFLLSAYQNAEIIEENISNKKDYLYFSKIVKILNEKDPNLYLSKIWSIKIAALNNKSEDEIKGLINSAIKLAPAREEAYRLGLNYFSSKDDDYYFKSLCKKYHTLNLGGTTSQYIQPNFFGFTLSKFAIEPFFENLEAKYYVNDGIILNEFQSYVFTLEKPISIKGINIHTSFLPGSKVEIASINFTNKDNSTFTLPLNSSYIKTQKSYIDTSGGRISIIGPTTNENEVTTINFDKTYNLISKINMRLKFSRMQLTNKSGC